MEHQVQNPYHAYEQDRAQKGQRSWVLDNWLIIVLGIAVLGKLFGIIKVPWVVIIVPMIAYWAVVGYAIHATIQNL